MNRAGIKSLLESATLIKVYPDFIRNGVALPAIAFDHGVNVRTGRDISGKASGKSDTWRVTIIGKSRSECDDIVSQIELLDGTSDANFALVEVLSITDGFVSEKDKEFRISVDLRTFDK